MHNLAEYALVATGTTALYMLLAQGILIVYRGSGILNFAQGAFVMFGAYEFHALRGSGVALGPTAVVTVVTVTVLGAVTNAVVVRPLRDASLVSRIVATLAVVILLAEFVNLRWPSGGAIEPVLPDRALTIAGVQVTEDRLLFLLVATVTAAVLWGLYRFTSFGLATQAVSENRRGAAALGWSPDAIATGSWALAGALAGLTAVLISAVQSALDTTTLTLSVVPALAVALIAGFRSFPGAAFGALGLATLQQGLSSAVVAPHPGLQGLQQIVPLVAIVVALFLRGDTLPSRAQRSERRPLLGTGVLRPWLVLAVVAGCMLSIWTFLPPVWVAAVSLQATLLLIVLSLVVVLGYAGQLSLGQMAFAGIAALIAGRLIATQGWSFPAAALVGVAGAACAGMVFGLPALRTRGVALGIVTLALGAAVYSFLFSRVYTSPAPAGAGSNLIFGTKPQNTVVGAISIFGVPVDPAGHPEAYATLCVAIAALLALVVLNVRRGSAGRRLVAVRTNERAAASLGINVSAAKLYGFTLSAAIAGAGGILLSFRESVISYSVQYNPLQSIYTVGFAVIGGVGSVAGAAIGATFFPGTIGAAVGQDLSDWFANIGEPRPWISATLVALLLGGLARVLAVTGWAPRRSAPVVAAVGVLAGAVLTHQVGDGLARLDDHVRLAPWIGALALAEVARLAARLLRARRAVPDWAPAAVFVVAAVAARLAVGEQAGLWISNLSKYLPLLGGIGLLAILLGHGDGIATTAAASLRRYAARPAVPEPVPLVRDHTRHVRKRSRSGDLELRGVTVSFGGVTAVSDLDFSVRAGEIVGLIGPNGAGKTTVVDAITGYARLAAGEITIGGDRVDGLAPHKRARRGVARTFQSLELFDDLTVLENLAAASDEHDMLSYVTNLVWAGRVRLSPMAVAAVSEFGLGPDLNHRADSLPHGRRRLVAVARALATEPALLLLDEPAAGLDETERDEFAHLVRALATDWGLGVLVIEHDMEFISRLCDRVVVMDFGTRIAEGTPADTKADPVVLAAYLGDPEPEEPAQPSGRAGLAGAASSAR